jgi:hypothetical protein
MPSENKSAVQAANKQRLQDIIREKRRRAAEPPQASRSESENAQVGESCSMRAPAPIWKLLIVVLPMGTAVVCAFTAAYYSFNEMPGGMLFGLAALGAQLLGFAMSKIFATA